MPHSQDSYTPPGSDETLYRMINPSLWNCRGKNWETTILTEALASTTQAREEKKSNFGQIIQLEILLSLLLIGVAVLVGINPQTNRVETSIDIHHTSQRMY